ncbi:MAG: hypothetical protein HQ534_05735 [Armatimonadetes bacterium]|nr:hypothetical protein [Armatimonadota bacterium]
MLKDIFKLNSRSKKLIAIMVIISIICILIAHFYYKNLNSTLDPRTAIIQELYKKYSKYVNDNDFVKVLTVLDSIENEYKKIEHYEQSYEVGVVYTNKSAVYLTMALYVTQDEDERTGFLNVSEEFLNKGIEYYTIWENKYKNLNKAELKDLVSSEFAGTTKQKIINRRIKDIKLALQEINRRYSVAYTNLGIVKRHQMKQIEAVECYERAIEYWENNYTAKSNLSVLLGGKPIKRSFLQKLFPPEKK